VVNVYVLHINNDVANHRFNYYSHRNVKRRLLMNLGVCHQLIRIKIIYKKEHLNLFFGDISFLISAESRHMKGFQASIH